MKNKNEISVLILVALVIVVVLTYHSKPTQKQTTNTSNPTATSSPQAAPIEISIKITTEAPSSEEGYAYSATESLGIASTSPDIGFFTGLTQYPNATWETKRLVSDEPRANIDIQYPQFIGRDRVTKLNEYIYSTLEQVINSDRQQVAQIIVDNPDVGRFESSVQLRGKYRVVGIKNGIVSLEIVTSDFTGGGNGDHDVSIPINWDLKSNRLLSPKDIFCSTNYIPTLTPLVKNQLTKYTNHNGLTLQDINIDSTSSADNWQNFLLARNGLIVIFQPYSIASGAVGIIRINIPDSEKPHFLCLP